MSTQPSLLDKGKGKAPAQELSFPRYWPNEGWKRLWGSSSEPDTLDLDQVRTHLSSGGVPTVGYESATLSRSSEMGRAICAYVSRNIVLKTYDAPKREATRMGWSQKIADNKDGQYTPKWVASAQERLKEGRKGGPVPPASGAVEIKKIRIIRNVKLWAGYVAMRESIREQIEDGTALRTVRFVTGEPDPKRLPVIDGEVGEVLLFHGTSKDTMKKIATTGFDPNFCVNKGTDAKPNYGALGRGVYFSDSFSKVMTYTVCHHCGAYQCDCSHKHGDGTAGSKRVTFLARVVLGAPKNKRAVGQFGVNDIRKQNLDSLPEDRHSVYARGFKFRDFKFVSGSNEFVVKDLHQMYPEFVVYWTHAQNG